MIMSTFFPGWSQCNHMIQEIHVTGLREFKIIAHVIPEDYDKSVHHTFMSNCSKKVYTAQCRLSLQLTRP